MKKTKILHVLYSGLGGHVNVLFSFIDADINKEFKYAALFNGIENPKEEYIKKCKESNVDFYYVSKKPGLDLSYFKNIFKTIRKNNADIIFLHSSSYILPAKMAALLSRKKPKIIVRETHANHLKTKMNNVWLFAALLFAGKVVFLSEEYKTEILQKHKWFYPKKRIAVIPNGINLKIFHPQEKIPAPIFTIGMQSRLVDIKDHITLLKAFALLKKTPFLTHPVKLKIAGEGNFERTLRNYAKELSISDDVDFTGFLAEKELSYFLQSLSVYVHASLGETMSTAIMQAMSCSLPIIASDVKGINNMVKNNKTGILVPPLNAIAMAEAINELYNDSELSKKLAENAFQFARLHYSNITMFQRYKKLFEF